MTDQELLELAAKAAGIEIEWNVMINRTSPILAPKTPQERNWLGHEHTPWNPLTDDGDALRLAVQLEIKFSCRADEGVGVWAKATCWRAAVEECAKADKYAATRRAIVRAAAAIGEKMEEGL